MDSPCTSPEKSSTSRVSKKILEYCIKFGKDRDLEKFMRMHSSSSQSSKSSFCPSVGNSEDEEKRQYTAMQKLFIINNPECHFQSKVCVANKGEDLNRISQSNVEIPIVESDLKNDKLDRQQEKLSREIYKFATKQNSSTSAATAIANTTEVSEEARKPMECNSNKRLEWDSLADVGYKKLVSSSNLSSLERSILGEFFIDRKLKAERKTNNTSESDLKRLKEYSKRSSTHSPCYSENWRRTLDTIKKKYSTPPLASSTLIDLKPMECGKKLNTKSPDLIIISSTTQNTPISSSVTIPKISESTSLTTQSMQPPCCFEYVSGSSITTDAEIIGIESEHTDKAVPDKPFENFDIALSSSKKQAKCNIKCVEKYCQTTFNYVETISKEIQANLSSSISQSNAGSLVTPSSFEFCGSSLSDRDILKHRKSSEILSGESHASRARYILQANNSSRRNSKSDKGDVLTAQSTSTTWNEEADKENIRSVPQLSLGIQLLCSLIDAQNLNRKQKKNLVRDIVAKMCKISSSSSSTSQLSSLSMQSLIKSLSTTISEISVQESSKTKDVKSATKKLIDDSEKEHQTKSTITSSASSLKHSTVKKSNAATSTEVDRMVMSEWLNPMTQSEFEHQQEQTRKELTSLLSSSKMKTKKSDLERCTQLCWIENEIKRLEGLKHLLLKHDSLPSHRSDSSKSANYAKSKIGTKVSPETTLYDTVCSEKSYSQSDIRKNANNVEVILEESSEDLVNSVDNYKRSIHRNKETDIIYEKSDGVGIQKKKIFTKEATTITIDEEQCIPYQKGSTFVAQDCGGLPKTNRSKMKTPTQSVESESVGSFVQQRKQKFLDYYHDKKKAHRDAMFQQRQQTHTYSEPRSGYNRHTNLTKSTSSAYTTPASTNTSSSIFCISSDMSIPMMPTSGTSSSTTTTHQYDDRCGIGIQTGDSLLKTRPIFGPSLEKINGCQHRHTQRLQMHPGKNQLVQVKPKAVAYVITFDENRKTTTPFDNSNVPPKQLTLQEQLQLIRPEFFLKADQRQSVLYKLHSLRQQRDQEIRAIVENTSINSIPKKLRNLPPPPIKKNRILSTKEMKAITNKRYSRLPEVIEKAEREKDEKRRKGNRLLKDIFNKKLQKRVHAGKLSLNHSGTVI